MSSGQDLEQKINEAERLKSQGNEFFKLKEFVKALRAYHKGLLYISGIVDKESPMAMYAGSKLINEQDSERIKQIKFSLWMNMSQIYVFQQKFDKGLDVLNKAGTIKQNQKLYYRKAKCYMHTGEFQKAKQNFNKILTNDEGMKATIKKQLALLRQLEKRADQKSKKMYAKFFTSSESDEKKQSQENKKEEQSQN